MTDKNRAATSGSRNDFIILQSGRNILTAKPLTHRKLGIAGRLAL
jgi:hypothetical protein